MSEALAQRPAAARDGEAFAWTQDDFVMAQKLIHRHAGIRLHDGKQAMVYSRLSRRLRETGHRSFRDYLRTLHDGDGGELQEFINALTTNLTAFFREAHHFDTLRAHLAQAPEHGWRIWCSAASTGEEPYSIAITAAEALGRQADFSVQATDIDSRVLQQARQGIYAADKVRDVAPERLRRFFERGRGSNAGRVRVAPALGRHVEFLPLNLIAPHWPLGGPFDVIFCRNVMIYFDAATQLAVLQRMHALLRPGGLLFLGHAENIGEARSLFRLRGKTAYERCA